MLLEKITGKRIPVTITNMQLRDLNQMRNGWTPGFNWRLYFRMPNVEVYKIMVLESELIQGAIALESREDHVWVHLIEKAPHNRGPSETFDYVAHHLFAFAALRSFETADGFVAFEAKTGMIEHYIREYGAIQMGAHTIRMFIPDVAGRHLIDVYLR